MADGAKQTERNGDMALRILESATELFAERGYEGTSVQAIADAVGIRKASLLYHYPSKETLHRRVLEELLSRWNDSLPALMLAATTSRDRFEAVIRAGVDFFAADSNRARLLVREMLDRPSEMQRLVVTHSHIWVKAICDALREGQEHGRVRAELDPEAYVIHVVNLVCGMAMLDPMSLLLDHRAGDGEVSEHAKKRFVDELMRIARVSLFAPRPTNHGRKKDG